MAGAVNVASAAGVELSPSASIPLGVEDLSFWGKIVAEKTKDEWTAHDLEVAAHLAQAMTDLVAARAKLRETGGPVLLSPDGKMLNNPFNQAVRDETARIVSLRSTLQIHGRGKNGEKRDVDKRRAVASYIEAAVSGDDLDGLLN